MITICRILGISLGPGGWEAEGMTAPELAQIMFPALVGKGPHAYGYMVNLGGEVWFDKWPGRCDTEAALEHLAKITPEPRWLVGHTRYATHGSPEDNRNNHPLQHGRILGVHNGVLRNHDAVLTITGRMDPKTEVDSEAIFAAVNEWGHRGGLRAIEGDMVTVYTDLDKPDTLHLARSYGRPLVYARTEAGSFIFASEEQAIKATGLKIGPISTLAPNTLLRVREGKIRSRITYREQPARRQVTAPYFAATGEEWDEAVERMRADSRERMRRAEDEYRMRIQDRASRRGQIFADRAAQEKAAQEKQKPQPAKKISDPRSIAEKAEQSDIAWSTYDPDRDAYWYQNRWMSEREYVSAVMDDLEVPLG